VLRYCTEGGGLRRLWVGDQHRALAVWGLAHGRVQRHGAQIERPDVEGPAGDRGTDNPYGTMRQPSGSS
jgi:hypothetical protein